MACKQCGTCCINNGLIPPLIPNEEAPEWLWTLVNRLRTEFGSTAEDYPCVFLTDDLRCSIYEMERPAICRDFTCEPEIERCSECGYTEQDARTEMDHKLCKNYGKAPWSDAIGEIPS